MENLKDLLRSLQVLAGPFDEFNTSNVPESPHELFIDWLYRAIEKQVPEPHAMTLSTMDAKGQPDARILILKNIDYNGWYFATSSKSRKGKQIAEETNVALTFYWLALGKQVRIWGKTIDMGNELSAADFLERSEIARAGAFIGKQSTPLMCREDLELALAYNLNGLYKNQDLIYSAWRLYCVQAHEVEFWQGSIDRQHIRLQYRLQNNRWFRELLWP